MLDSMLGQAGLRVGRFTSPHLVEPRDSITVGGRPVDAAVFARASAAVAAVGADASPFERLTATAFRCFADEGQALDMAIVEVGMGGADDATNMVPDPLVSVITAIDLDHQALLGNTVGEIARVKAGIMKAGRPVVAALQAHDEATRALGDAAGSVGATRMLTVAAGRRGTDTAVAVFEGAAGPALQATLALHGDHQLANAAVAIATARVLRNECRDRVPKLAQLTDDAIVYGLEHVAWPGRLSWVDLSARGLRVLADGAHNPSSAALLAEYLRSHVPGELTLVVGLSRPREPASILEPIARIVGRERLHVVGCPFTTPVEGMPWVAPVEPGAIAEAAAALGMRSSVASSLDEAIALSSESQIVVCGSLYLVADLYRAC